MMYEQRSRKIARLEKIALPYIASRVGIKKQWRKLVRGAIDHASVLAFLVRHGNPRIDEPLSEACQRAANSEAWKFFRDKIFPPRYRYVEEDTDLSFSPHSRDEVIIIGGYLRHMVISGFPGVDEKAKLNAVFKSAPPWLIWFTFADYTAALLDLELPDLSGIRCFARSREAFDCWWGLPKNAFERRRWPKGPECELLAGTDLSLLRPEPAAEELGIGRRRGSLTASSQFRINWTSEWLQPPSLELRDMDLRTVLSLSGAPGFIEEKRHPEFCGDDLSPPARHRGSDGF